MAQVDQIINTARTYMDEPDQTFLTDTIMEAMMGIAYQEFRQKVMQADPNILATTMDLTLAGVNSVDLSAIPTPILGAPAAAEDRMVKLLSVYVVDTTTGLPQQMFTGVGNIQALAHGGSLYYLQGTTLWLSWQVTDTLRLVYVPSGKNVSWQTTNTAQPDDLEPVHDLIPLYAFRQYQMMDSAVSEALAIQISAREKALEEYLMTRSIGGPDYVKDVTTRDFYL